MLKYFNASMAVDKDFALTYLNVILYDTVWHHPHIDWFHLSLDFNMLFSLPPGWQRFHFNFEGIYSYKVTSLHGGGGVYLYLNI